MWSRTDSPWLNLVEGGLGFSVSYPTQQLSSRGKCRIPLSLSYHSMDEKFTQEWSHSLFWAQQWPRTTLKHRCFLCLTRKATQNHVTVVLSCYPSSETMLFRMWRIQYSIASKKQCYNNAQSLNSFQKPTHIQTLIKPVHSYFLCYQKHTTNMYSAYEEDLTIYSI